MSFRLRVAPRAAEQIRAANAWWESHRPNALSAFADEIQRGFELVRSLPGAGEQILHPRHEGLRRLLLGRVRYHLYYVVSSDDEAVDVLALWHTARGVAPEI